MQTEAQRRATDKWQAKNLTNVAARVRRETAEEFKTAAQAAGTTPNALLKAFIEDYIKGSR